MGACGGRSAVVVVNSKVNPNLKKLKYELIQLNLKAPEFSETILTDLDLEYCAKYSIGPFFLNKNNTNFFSQVFKSEVKSSYDSMVLFTQYDSYIKKDKLTEKNIEELKQFILSKNILNLDSLTEEELRNNLLYCTNNIFRIEMYFKILKEIPLSPSFQQEHGEGNEESISESQDSYLSKSKKQIFLDIYRTYPHNLISEDPVYCNNFYSILYEISIRNSNIAYTQGMNFLCGFILMLCGNKKDESFYFFTKILSLPSKKFSLCFEQCFFLGFTLLKKYVELFNELLQKNHPELYERVTSIGVISEVWFGKWIMLLFVTNFEFEQCLKFWDIILAYGLDSLICICLSVCDILKEKIMKCETIDQFNQVIHNGKVKLSPKEKGELYKLVYSNIKSNKYDL